MMIQAKDRKIIALAATSRIICLSLVILADLSFTDLATSAHLSNFQCLSPATSSRAPLNLNPYPTTSLDHLAPWDSMYFVRIAKCGYENDMINAFFPLLPMLMRTLDIVTGSRWLLGHCFPPESRYTLHGMLISFISFIIAALALHKLSYKIFSSYLLSKSRKNKKKRSSPSNSTSSSGGKSTPIRETDGMKIPNRLADTAVLLFCFNPASVFYTIGYTESLFAACTFTGMYFLHKNRLLLSTLAFTAGALSRSNGILSIWFPLHRLLSHIYTTWWHHLYNNNTISGPSTVHRHPRNVHRHNHHHPQTIATTTKYNTWSSCVGETIKTLLACTCICLPYIIIQVIAYFTYCTSSNVVDVHDDPERAWCTRKMGGILLRKLPPAIYSHVQDKYWDVGFLRFYTKLDRWPSLLQSVPIFGFCIAACWVYFSSNWERTSHLDLWTEDRRTGSDDGDDGDDDDETNAARITIIPPLPSRGDTSSSPVKMKGSNTSVWQRYLLNNDTPAPYFHYTALMTATAIFIMHVNVGTRFLSTCPPLYWYVATLMYPYYYYCNVVRGRGKWVRRGVWVWCLGFTAAGCVLWPNFYPWT
jgi:phosphatidylinositol glycan class V